ncbi:N-acetylglucosaminyl deacetylase, LmbE family [Actinopolyspora xinjiangensis]|uniref:N-acetylglucosaminyl deacetylase, LmbE family n=1 Tax=Actinopolyspora xinjiangensis TaxID=405564 RepID=A0A1H0VK94_9ACTN|nr:PIG-L deacetylase family protein [Actinopolyspora xinjiangensis]SDP79012.1 N-acetylglucosaminyl deacetylase, LmbE family [Actinopolyspora xinjiangensis]
MTESLEPMPTDWRHALVIVAHPDDVEFAACAAVARWTEEGHGVSYLLASRGEAGIDGLAPEQAGPLREREQRASAALVGVEDVRFLDHRDGVIEEGTALRRDLARGIREVRPELVVTFNHYDRWGFGGWNSPDHRAVGRAALDAVGDAGNRWIFPELVTEENLPPWNGVRRIAVAGSPHPTHAVDVGPTLGRAVESLAAHATYLSALTEQAPEDMARDFLHRTTAEAGAAFGVEHAVTFELVS